MNVRDELRRALSAWRLYEKAEPWLEIESDALFRIDDERSARCYYASILGRQGVLHGFTLSEGHEGLRLMGGLVRDDLDFDQALTGPTSICITRDDGPVPRWYLAFLRNSLGRKGGVGKLPFLYVNESHHPTRPPTPGEVSLIADALKAVTALYVEDALKPPLFKAGRPLPCIHLLSGGTHEITEVTPVYEPPRVERYEMPPDRGAALRELPRPGGTDLVSCHVAPALVQGRKVRLLMIVEADEGTVLGAQCMELDDREAIARSLQSIYQGRNATARIGLPQEIETDSRYFYEAFKDALAEVGIRVICFRRIPALERLRDSLSGFLDSPGRSRDARGR